MPANKSPAASHGDELIIPFLFIPEGQSPPEDWLQAHPGAIRIPATVVLRRDGSIAGIKIARNEGDTVAVPATPGSFAPVNSPGRPRAAPPNPMPALAPGTGDDLPWPFTLASAITPDPSTQLIPVSTAPAATNSTPTLSSARVVSLTQPSASILVGGQNVQPNGSGADLPLAAYQQLAAANVEVQSDATTTAVQSVNYYTSTINNTTASALGMTRDQLRKAIHSLKAAIGLGGADNVQIHVPSGEVFFNGESIGNLNDE